MKLWGDELARIVDLRVLAPVPDLTTLAGIATASIVDGAMCVVGTGTTSQSNWMFVSASAVATDATHQRPTDFASAGVWYQVSAALGTGQGDVQHVVVAIPLATIQAQASGVAFNVGAALPTNARLIDYNLNVTTAISGGTISACVATLQGGADAAGSLIASHSVFTGANPTNSPVGSNPYPSRSGQQLKMTLTSTGDTLAHATAGVLSLDLFYAIIP